jgi:hypothetical protein
VFGVLAAVGAFGLPIAFSASPAGAQTTTTASSSSTSTSTTAVPTSTTLVATSTTVSPPVGDEVVVVIGANGEPILAQPVVSAQATGEVLAQTGSSPMPLWLTGLTLVLTGALALMLKQRRHLNFYVLRSSRPRS